MPDKTISALDAASPLELSDHIVVARGATPPNLKATIQQILNLGGGGDVSGPASVGADGNIPRYSGTTGKILKDGSVNLNAAGDLTGVRDLSLTGALTVSGMFASAKLTDNGTSLIYLGEDFALAGSIQSGTVGLIVFNQDDIGPNSDTIITVETDPDGGGDPYFRWLILNRQGYVMGIDKSDSNKLVLSLGNVIGVDNVLEITSAGASTFKGALTVDGASTLTGNVAVAGTLASGNMAVTGTLSTSSRATLESVVVTNDLTVAVGSLKVTAGHVSIGQSISATHLLRGAAGGTGIYALHFSRNIETSTVPVVRFVQNHAGGAQPVLELQQDDISEGFIDFVGSDRGVIANTLASLKSVRVELGGVKYRLALYVDA